MNAQIAKILNISSLGWLPSGVDETERQVVLASLSERVRGLQQQEFVTGVYAQTTSAALPTDFHANWSSFTVTIMLSELEQDISHSKILAVSSVLTAEDVVQTLSVKLGRIGDPLPHPPSEYVLKRCGYSQYLPDLASLASFLFVRDAIKTGRRIMLSLVLRSSMPPIDSDTYSPEAARDFDCWFDQLFPAASLRSGTDWIGSHELKRPFEFQVQAVSRLKHDTENRRFYIVAELYHGNRKISPSMITASQGGKPATTGSASASSLSDEMADSDGFVLCQGYSVQFGDWLRSSIKISDLPQETRLCLTVYTKDTTSMSLSLRSRSKTTISSSDLQQPPPLQQDKPRASFFSRAGAKLSSFGSVPSTPPLMPSFDPSFSSSSSSSSSSISSRNPDQPSPDDKPLPDASDLPQHSSHGGPEKPHSPASLYNLPTPAQPSRDDVPVAHINCILFDSKGHLLSGEVHLQLYPKGPANPIGTCIENLNSPDTPTLTLYFHQYPFPVLATTPSAPLRPLPPTAQPSEEEQSELVAVLNYDPLTPLSLTERTLVWSFRGWCLLNPEVPAKSLIKVLGCVDWTSPPMVQEAYRLLHQWPDPDPIDALELLDAKFANRQVRKRAVHYLNRVSNIDLRSILLQLVQVIKYEPKHISYVLCWLLFRARLSPVYVGHPLFWHLYAEIHSPEIGERFRIMLEFFLRLCPPEEREAYAREVQSQWYFKEAASHLQQTPHSKRKEVLSAELARISQFEGHFRLPIDPTRVARNLILDSCKYMTSAKAPLWLVFQNVSSIGEPIPLMFKYGDDLRQDQLTLQMMALMNRLWLAQGLDLRLSLYGAVSTGDYMGYIEVVQNSMTLANIQKEQAGVAGAFISSCLSNWLRLHNSSPEQYGRAVENFTHSCAGYCVATYVLGIGDRHNDNIMVNKNGMLFHIDFGHFLGNVKRFIGVRRERSPFIFTTDFLAVLGGQDSEQFKTFVDMACRGYNILRKCSTLFINLFAMMLSTGIPELRSEEDIRYLREAFSLDLSDEDATQLFSRLIFESLNTKSTAVNFGAHIFAQKFSLGI